MANTPSVNSPASASVTHDSIPELEMRVDFLKHGRAGSATFDKGGGFSDTMRQIAQDIDPDIEAARDKPIEAL